MSAVPPLLARAIELAARAGRAAAPNPRVGAVVARDALVLGEGWHHRAGEAHAEVLALGAAGAAARGAVLYTSLEPCDHTGRTPPCTEAIVAAGIARVVVAAGDPDPRVSGRGLARLRAAGLAVECAGAAARDAAERVNEDYLVHRRAGRAFAALKVAATLDGRIAERGGRSQWITGEAARARGRALRDLYGAILVGAETVAQDDPQLLPPPRADAPLFLRCVIDGTLRTSPAARLFADAATAPVVIFTRPDAPAPRRAALERAGAETVALGPPGGPIPPEAILRELGRRGVLGVLVEGGGRTHGAFLAAGVADKLYWFCAPRLLADGAARAALDGGAGTLAAAPPWHVHSDERVGGDILLTLYPPRP